MKGCHYCEKYMTITLKHPDTVKRLKNSYIVAKIMSDSTPSGDEYYRKYDTGSPSVAVFNPDQTLIYNSAGYKSPGRFTDFLNEIEKSNFKENIEQLEKWVDMGYREYGLQLIDIYEKLGQFYKRKNVISKMYDKNLFSETEKPYYYHILIEEYERSNPSKSIELINNLKKLTDNKYNFFKYSAIYVRARIYSNSGDNQSAINFLKPYIDNPNTPIAWIINFNGAIDYYMKKK